MRLRFMRPGLGFRSERTCWQGQGTMKALFAFVVVVLLLVLAACEAGGTSAPKDDHGDTPGTATEVSVGEAVGASVDSRLDTDYFRFQAEEGRLYYIGVSGVWDDEVGYNTKATGALLGPDGITRESISAGSSDGETRIFWQAPASDTYYVRVKADTRGVDDYTLEITLLPEDDYGDRPSTAREIGAGEAVEGMIGRPHDRDYFKLTAAEGQVYQIDVSYHLQNDRPNVVLHGPGGPLQESSSIFFDTDRDTERILWAAPSQGDYYISVEFPYSLDIDPYTLRVIPIDDIVDDHSDGAIDATGLTIGETVVGNLDYEFDLDYFKFRAAEG